MKDSQRKNEVGRRDFLKIGGASAAALGAAGNLAAKPEAKSSQASPSSESTTAGFAPDTKYPKLAIITTYSRERLAFASAAGYEGVVIPLDDFFDPDKLSDTQIDQILA